MEGVLECNSVFMKRERERANSTGVCVCVFFSFGLISIDFTTLSILGNCSGLGF